LLTDRSKIVSDRVSSGRCAIACVNYKLADGRALLHKVIGDIGETV